MKGLTAIALLFALGTVAAAKPAPVEQARPGIALSDVDINIGPSAGGSANIFRRRKRNSMPAVLFAVCR